MEQGELLLLPVETAHARPVLVISPKAFNQVNKMLIVLPVTISPDSETLPNNLGFAVNVALPKLKAPGVIRCDQPRTLDINTDEARKLGKVSEEVLQEVMAKFKAIFL